MSLNLSKPCPDFFNAAEYCIAHALPNLKDKPALIFVQDEKIPATWTYEQLWNEVLKLSSGIQNQNLPLQSRLLIHLPSGPDYAFVFFAAMHAGFIPIPSYESLKTEELSFLLDDSQSALLITNSTPSQLPPLCRAIRIEDLKSASLAKHPSNTKANDPAFLVYTSGTTHRPKGVLHAHRMVWGRRPIRQCLLDISQNDILLHTDTLNYTYTFGVQLMDTWASGATALMYSGEKDPTIWATLINRYKATLFASTPSIFEQILQNVSKELRLPSLRHCISAGDVLKTETIEKWEKTTSIPLYESLGMTEINLFISTDHATSRKKGSIGKPQEGRKVAVLPLDKGTDPVPKQEVGCLAVHRSDPGLMLGYWHRPAEEKEAFRGEWFLTGDLVHQDEEEYIFFHGRTGTLLKIESDIVSPAEIEAVVEHCPGILEVGCWAVEGPEETPILSLFAVVQKGKHLTEEAILSYAKKHLSDFKCPKKVFFLQSLPRDSRGKLLRRKLPEKIATGKK